MDNTNIENEFVFLSLLVLNLFVSLGNTFMLMKAQFYQLKKFLGSKKIAPLVDVALFIIITYVVHVLWWHYSSYIYSIPVFISISNWLSHNVFLLSAWISVNILRMDLDIAPGNTLIFLKNNTSIIINESCSGFKQMFQILVLFVLFPGPWKHKLWFIPSAIAGMFFVNVIRVIGLSYAMIWWPEHWDFIHLWIMRPFYYVAIFIMWLIWEEKFRNRSSKV